jgi:hypothetical protein
MNAWFRAAGLALLAGEHLLEVDEERALNNLCRSAPSQRLLFGDVPQRIGLQDDYLFALTSTSP